MQERREGPRAAFHGWVELTMSATRSRGTALDLSERGIGVELRPPLPPPSSPVTSEFALPGISLPLALEGRVVWCDPERGRVGVRFESVDPGVEELLAGFVAGRL